MNWPFILTWLLIFAGIITACSMIGRAFGSTLAGAGVGILCVFGILFYGAIKTPWFH